jgi:hypothetical protein
MRRVVFVGLPRWRRERSCVASMVRCFVWCVLLGSPLGGCRVAFLGVTDVSDVIGA